MILILLDFIFIPKRSLNFRTEWCLHTPWLHRHALATIATPGDQSPIPPSAEDLRARWNVRPSVETSVPRLQRHPFCSGNRCRRRKLLPGRLRCGRHPGVELLLRHAQILSRRRAASCFHSQRADGGSASFDPRRAGRGCAISVAAATTAVANRLLVVT